MKSREQLINEIEARVRPTFRTCDGGTVESLQGRISQVDFDTLITFVRSQLAAERGGFDRVLQRHPYEPNAKYPWFCTKCGYAEHEKLQHY